MKKLLLIAAIAISSVVAKAQKTQLFCYNTRITYEYDGYEWVIVGTEDYYDCITIPLEPGTLEKVEYLDNGWISKAYVFSIEGVRYSAVYYFRGDYVAYCRVLREGNSVGYGVYFDKTKS